MKLRKTRIKKEIKANGSIEYIPEYKYWFWWTSFADLYADSDVFNISVQWIKQKSDNGETLERNEAQCKELIDFYVRQVKYQQACEIENAVVKTEYEKYP